jgi:hypothetical protein
VLETPNLRHIWLAVAATTVLFRVQTGKAWVQTSGSPRRVDGGVFLPGGRPVALGFSAPNGDAIKGTSDLVGHTSIVVTQEMVGRRIAVFTVIEAKCTDGGRVSSDQHHFIDAIRRAGGIAGVASSPNEAKKIIDDYTSTQF